MKSRFPLIVSLIALLFAQSHLLAEEANTTDDGVYYLKVRVSITTDSGILSLNGGTKLHLVKKTADGMKAKTDDGVEVKVKDDQVTKDADFAAKLAKEEADKIAAQQAQVAAATQAAADNQKQAQEQRQQAMDRIALATPQQPAASAPTHALTGSALDNKPKGDFKMGTPVPAKTKKKK